MPSVVRNPNTLKHGFISHDSSIIPHINKQQLGYAPFDLKMFRRRRLSLLACVPPPRHTDQNSGGPGSEQRLALAAKQLVNEAADPIHK